MADLDQIYAELVTLRGELQAMRAAQASAARPVLSVAEAMELVGADSLSAFYRWTKKRNVKPSASGRYARRALLAGLDREVRDTAKRKPKSPPMPPKLEVAA
jgi:hypothetical protein